ncbi:xylulokinase [Herbaspirillum frisingense GSF30]|uniref:Xylulose kinase n=1 Tax=Herbaspirillum frisingense GSF30 TaxID=864073 RepID=A0AAI9IB73_9BURK|nr:xylulokinase [Herbaspirillum frisingense]EOA02907.1 xylulokinase [Herbaspirillum frisingense GSF30]
MTACLLGIDLGTSACKALLLSTDARILASASVDYPVSQPRERWVEQEPAHWIAAARQAVAQVLQAAGSVEVLCIGLSGQMHGLTALDQHYRPLRPAILWNDQRNQAEADRITQAAGGLTSLLAHTGNRMLVGYTGGKLLWMQQHEPQWYEQLRVALNPKDYLRYVLTGEIATEVSDASGTGLFDVRRRQWATELIALVGLDSAHLPACFESQVVSGHVHAQAAAMFGIAAGIPVIGGGGDSVIQSLGAGVVAPGTLQTTIGTAGIVAAALDQPLSSPDGRIQVFCNVADQRWHAMGVSLNAGGALAWFRNVLCAGAGESPSFEAIAEAAGRSVPGAHGLLFLPYLNGERCPHPDPSARAAFIGLHARHDHADLSRSVLEGVVHSLCDMQDLMRSMGVSSSEVSTSGGGARSAVWRQIQADMLGCDVLTRQGAAEGAALGAALLAGVSMQVWPDIDHAASLLPELTRERPDVTRRERYEQARAIYQQLYPLLTGSFARLGALAELGEVP